MIIICICYSNAYQELFTFFFVALPPQSPNTPPCCSTDEARHWLLAALELGHLKFLRKAGEELQRVALAPLADIAAVYARRCGELEAAEGSPA